MSGFKVEVHIPPSEWCGNGETWPDRESADAAGRNLLSRWFVPDDYRVVEVEEEPNRPTWTEWVRERGLPPQSVTL